jgi:hypothetical protein
MEMALFGGAKVVFVLELQNYFFWKNVIRPSKINNNIFFNTKSCIIFAT